MNLPGQARHPYPPSALHRIRPFPWEPLYLDAYSRISFAVQLRTPRQRSTRSHTFGRGADTRSAGPISFAVSRVLLALLMLITAGAGAVGAWVVSTTLSADHGGNPLACVMVAAAIALAWGVGFNRLPQAYLTGQFALVRRRLRWWGPVLGVGETALVRLWIDVEQRVTVDRDRTLEAIAALGLEPFGRAWTTGHTSRLEGALPAARAAFEAGARTTEGLDRAELLCEAALILLQHPTPPATTGGIPGSLSTAISHLNAAEVALDTGRRSAPRLRGEYVATFVSGLRGLVLLAQGRPTDADRRLDQVVTLAGHLIGLRIRRMGALFAIEQLWIRRLTGDRSTFLSACDARQMITALPGLRLRVCEILQADVALAREEIAQAQRAQAASVAPSTTGHLTAEPPPEDHGDRIEFLNEEYRPIATRTPPPAAVPPRGAVSDTPGLQLLSDDEDLTGAQSRPSTPPGTPPSPPDHP